MTHDLVLRYRKTVARFDARLSEAVEAGDAAAIGRATVDAEAARAALAAMEREAGTIQWAHAMRGGR